MVVELRLDLKEKQGIVWLVPLRLQQGLTMPKCMKICIKQMKSLETLLELNLPKVLKQKNDSPRTGTHRVVVKKIFTKIGLELDTHHVYWPGLQSSFKKRRITHGYFNCFLLQAYYGC